MGSYRQESKSEPSPFTCTSTAPARHKSPPSRRWPLPHGQLKGAEALLASVDCTFGTVQVYQLDGDVSK